MSMRRRDMVKVVEAAYRLELDEGEWLQGLADLFATMHGGAQGVMVYVHDATDLSNGVRIPAYALNGLDDSFAQGTRLHNAKTPISQGREVYRSGVVCSTVSEILAPLGRKPLEQESFALGVDSIDSDIQDAWGLSASNPGGRGVSLAAPLYEITKLSDSLRELWGLVGVHLATAYRLRSRDTSEQPAAVLDPDGRVRHAEGEATDADVRRSLAEATRNVERARSQKLRHHADEALPMWRGLVEGRWSLVDREDTDGRRFVVAQRNDLDATEPPSLTQIERQVVLYAAQGESNARIAYWLGLDSTRVARELSRALNKLGVDSRDQLADLLRMAESFGR